MGNSTGHGTAVTTVSSLVPLVKRLAGRFKRDYWTPADREDILQEGFMGLMEAASRYEPDRGCALSTFAGPRVVGAMFDYVRTICRRSREKATEEIPQDLLNYRADQGDSDTPRSPESGVMLLRFSDFLGSDLDGVGFLDDDEREIIRLRFFEGKSCREAAESMGVSAATICRVERTALVRLRKNFVLKYCGPAASSSTRTAPAAGPEPALERASVIDGDKTHSGTFDDIIASLAL